MAVFTSGHGHGFPFTFGLQLPLWYSRWQLRAMAQQFCVTTWHRA